MWKGMPGLPIMAGLVFTEKIIGSILLIMNLPMAVMRGRRMSVGLRLDPNNLAGVQRRRVLEK